jgi:hypothetical protein
MMDVVIRTDASLTIGTGHVMRSLTLAEAFKTMKPLFSDCASPYLLPRHLVQDIDTPEDWMRAELMYQVLNASGELDKMPI